MSIEKISNEEFREILFRIFTEELEEKAKMEQRIIPATYAPVISAIPK